MGTNHLDSNPKSCIAQLSPELSPTIEGFNWQAIRHYNYTIGSKATVFQASCS